ncbi:MAG: carbohydrate kinase family protein [Methanobacteriaceae archaeon]|nr:carbohydrate kinase family protein [Methanobacteriaceae archaeon]
MDIIGLGTCNADFILKIPRFVCGDDEVEVEQFFSSLGGSASNFCVALSRLNVKTGIMARIGDDELGKWALDKFKEEGVDIERLVSVEGSTGMTFIAVDPSGERSIYSFTGANKQFKVSDDDINYIKKSKILHISGIYCEVADEASKHSNQISLNPGTLLSAYGIDKLLNIIKRTKFLFLNKKELLLLTNKDLKDGAQILLDEGVPIVIVTQGCDGASVFTQEDIIHSSACDVKVVDTTGAGDAFAAGFLAAYSKNKDILDCLEFANQVAAECVQKWGPMNVPRNFKY